MGPVLVLGATGFLGRAVSTQLEQARVKTVRHGRRQAAGADDHRSLDLAVADVRPLARLIDDVRPEVIVNCVGSTHGTPAELVAANTDTVTCIVGALRLARVRPRLVHLGSAAEYGAGVRGRLTREDDATRPASPYGATKLEATELLTAARRRGEIEACTLRIFNALGAGMSPQLLAASAASKLLQAVESGRASIETGPLDAVRDFVDVRDVIRAVIAASLAPTTPPPVVNIGRGVPVVARALVEELARQARFSGEIVETSAASPRSADVAWLVADVALARETFGWWPSHDLASMCASLLEVG